MVVTSCPGCGYAATSSEGPTHAYIGASPACWALFSRALVEDLGSPAVGPLLGDAYAAQHPGTPQRRAVQSVGVHLVALCAALERGWSYERLVEVRRIAVGAPVGFWTWLDPATPLGTLTVANVLAPTSGPVRAARVTAYVDDVWQAYSQVHDTVRDWTRSLLHAR